MTSSQSNKEVTTFKFGALEFRVEGLGVYFAGPVLLKKIAALSPDELRTANREAWKQKRAWARRSEQAQFMSDWDRTVMHEQVAEQVCKATWKALQS